MKKRAFLRRLVLFYGKKRVYRQPQPSLSMLMTPIVIPPTFIVGKNDEN